MVVEPIQSVQTGATGWTVTWKGRGGGSRSPDYLLLVTAACSIARSRDLLIVPSVNTTCPHLGKPSGVPRNMSRQTRAILDAYQSSIGLSPMPLEKDFSPTLAGSDRVSGKPWFSNGSGRVPDLIRSAAPGAGQVKWASSSSTASTDDPFQLAMPAEVHSGKSPADFVIYANRLFDPNRVFEGKQGVAYGGPDLSDRNLRVLSAFALFARTGRDQRPAAGNQRHGRH